MLDLAPPSPGELADVLREAASQNKSISLRGNGSKDRLGGPILAAEVCLSTKALRRVLAYEPRDLTISVEAGMPFSELQGILAKQGQMLALDPSFSAKATVGGVIATNASGPMRRGFGTARDLVIGMSFAMLDGRLIKAGGMVVKNVAGLDIGKLMIGSFGTLAAITSVNFRLHPIPQESKTFLFHSPDLASALERRDQILRSVFQPTAIDLLSPEAGTGLGLSGYTLAVRVSGSAELLQRYTRDWGGGEGISGQKHSQFWRAVREFTPNFLTRYPEGVVLRISTTLKALALVLSSTNAACVSRAGSGVTFAYLPSWSEAQPLLAKALENRWVAVVESAPMHIRESEELWKPDFLDEGGQAFAMMGRVKLMFDPHRLLNRRRLYARI